MAPHHHAKAVRHVSCAVVTVSDTRTPADDRSGPLICRALEARGHQVAVSTIVADEVDAIRAAVLEVVGRVDVQAVIVTGGTGIAPRDVTIESLAHEWTKELPGFGEIFRALSFRDRCRGLLEPSCGGRHCGKVRCPPAGIPDRLRARARPHPPSGARTPRRPTRPEDPVVTVRVLFFAYLRERAGVREVTLELSAGTTIDA